jgi:hypothetical protein
VPRVWDWSSSAGRSLAHYRSTPKHWMPSRIIKIPTDKNSARHMMSPPKRGVGTLQVLIVSNGGRARFWPPFFNL